MRAVNDDLWCQQVFMPEEEGSDPGSLHNQETKGTIEEITLSFRLTKSYTLGQHFQKAGSC